MKHIVIDHLYSGQALSHCWMHITAADEAKFPHDNGYLVFYKGKTIGEVMVKERRRIKVGTINDTLSMMITGYSREYLIKDLEARNIPINDDTTIFLFCFQYLRYFERFRSAQQEAFDINYGKCKPLPQQSITF